MCVIPSVGVQLESVRGIRILGQRIPTQRQRTLLPRDTIIEFTMLEAIHIWNVVDYAAVITKTGEEQRVHVLFPNILPSLKFAVRAFCVVNKMLTANGETVEVDLCGIASGAAIAAKAASLRPDLFAHVSYE